MSKIKKENFIRCNCGHESCYQISDLASLFNDVTDEEVSDDIAARAGVEFALQVLYFGSRKRDISNIDPIIENFLSWIANQAAYFAQKYEDVLNEDRSDTQGN
jgi:hypothetical protein